MSHSQKQGTPVPADSVASDRVNNPYSPVSGQFTPDAVFDSMDSIYLAHASKLHDLSPYVRYNFDEMKSQYSDIVKSYNQMVDQYNEAMDTFCKMFACMHRAKKETRRAVAFIEAQGLIEMFNSKTE